MQSYINISSYVDLRFDIDEVFGEIRDSTLIKEMRRRRLNAQISDQCIRPVEDYKFDEFRRLLCDMLSLGYHVSNTEIIEKIKSNL